MNIIQYLMMRIFIPDPALIFDLLTRQLGMSLKRNPKRFVSTPEERRILMELGKLLGPQVMHTYLRIVSYPTYQRWLREEKEVKPHKPIKRGRPGLKKDIFDLVTRIARENAFGYGAILGTLRKLGINVSYTSVKNILRKAKIPTSAVRFRNHWHGPARTQFSPFLGCDFFTQKVWTFRGPLTYFVLFFFNIHTRTVAITGMTRRPTHKWVLKQALKFCSKYDGKENGLLIRDRDGKFSRQCFDAVFEASGFTVYKIPPRAPNCNAYAESWVARIKLEYLNRLFLFNPRQLWRAVKDYAHYYNTDRPKRDGPLGVYESNGILRSEPRLGGFYHHYWWE